MTYILWSIDFNLLAKCHSGELRCPATALIVHYLGSFDVNLVK